MRRKGREGESGPATLGTTARAHLLLRVWCKDCRHRADLDPGEQAERYGADLAVPEGPSLSSLSGQITRSNGHSEGSAPDRRHP